MRLIDADELELWLKRVGKFLKCEEDSKRVTKLIGKIIDHVNNAPTVEARPSGEWIKSETGVFICSKCNNGYKNQPTCMGHPMFEFCPMCGSKMKGADMRGEKHD